MRTWDARLYGRLAIARTVESDLRYLSCFTTSSFTNNNATSVVPYYVNEGLSSSEYWQLPSFHTVKPFACTRATARAVVSGSHFRL